VCKTVPSLLPADHRPYVYGRLQHVESTVAMHGLQLLTAKCTLRCMEGISSTALGLLILNVTYQEKTVFLRLGSLLKLLSTNSGTSLGDGVWRIWSLRWLVTVGSSALLQVYSRSRGAPLL